MLRESKLLLWHGGSYEYYTNTIELLIEISTNKKIHAKWHGEFKCSEKDIEF